MRYRNSSDSSRPEESSNAETDQKVSDEQKSQDVDEQPQQQQKSQPEETRNGIENEKCDESITEAISAVTNGNDSSAVGEALMTPPQNTNKNGKNKKNKKNAKGKAESQDDDDKTVEDVKV